MKDDEQRLDALLSQGELSGPEKDALWQRLDHAPKRAAMRWVLWLGAPSAAALLALIVLLPTDTFAPRGAGAVVVDLDCQTPCEELSFVVRGATSGFVYAWVSDGEEPLWLVPASHEAAPAITKAPWVAPARFQRPPGTAWVLHVVVSEKAIPREQAISLPGITRELK